MFVPEECPVGSSPLQSEMKLTVSTVLRFHTALFLKYCFFSSLAEIEICKHLSVRALSEKMGLIFFFGSLFCRGISYHRRCFLHRIKHYPPATENSIATLGAVSKCESTTDAVCLRDDLKPNNCYLGRISRNYYASST